MRTKFLSVAVTMAIAANVGCSVYKAGTQPGPADLTGIGIGTSRQDLIMRLGAPKFTDTNPAGKKEDAFEFSSGFHQASKARIILYLAADIFTLCLAEIILWPIELTLMERATCNGFAAYDEAHKVETWKVSQKDGVQDC
jgi:hypothetical protein